MFFSRKLGLFAPLLASALVIVAACGGHSTAPSEGTDPCPTGDEGCQCSSRKVCSGALLCLSGLCVKGPNSDAGGAPELSSSGAGSVLDTSGAGGFGATSPGSGGADAPNQPAVGGSGESTSELVANGDFSDGESHWDVTALMSTAVNSMVVDGALCIAVNAMAPFVVLGWPQDTSEAVALYAGKTYTLSYDVRSTGPLTVSVNAKVGLAVPPFTEDFSRTDDAGVDNAVRTFVHTRMLKSSDPQAGVALELTATGVSDSTTVCIDNVSLVETN